MEKSLTWEDVLAIAREVIANQQELPPNATIPDKTKRSQNILADWKKKCRDINQKLVTSNPNPKFKLFMFAIHDKQKGIVYELKLSKANPRVFLDKIVRKLVIYNTLQEANEEFYGLAQEIAGSNYNKIKEVHIFSYNDIIKEYELSLMGHYINIIKKRFNVEIFFHPLED